MPESVVGVVGLGALGTPLARNLLAAGRETWVFDVRPEAVAPLEALGARVASTPAALAAHIDVVLVAVSSGEQVEAVLKGDDPGSGIFATARPGTILVVHSTIGAERCRQIASLAAEHGISVVDAPVSGRDGGPASAARREMTYILGGRPEVLARVRPVLEISGRTHFDVGEVGAAQDVKLATNALTLTQMQATHETMRLLSALGLDPTTAAAILSESSASNWAVDHWQAIRKATDAPGDPTAIPRKDLALALRTAERLGLHLDLAERALDLVSQPGRGFLG